jgi:uncharacterized protein (DUF2236 family)
MSASEADLDALRLAGDPAVDDLVAAQAARSGDQVIGRLLGRLFQHTEMPDDDPLVDAFTARFAAEARARSGGDPARVAAGQTLFELYGPEVFLILGSYSLPLAYAAGNGVQVIHRARRLKDDPIRRLCDTAQMVLNVMQRGELEPGRVGYQSARKVRLIHALIRHHVRAPAAGAWPDAWGVPISQEDQAGTLLTFSLAPIHGLRRMGAVLTEAEADAYVYAWSAVGRLLGVHESLLPADEAAATALALQIGRRQMRATPEGSELAAQLMEAVGSLFPFPGYAVSLTRFFLQDTVFGADVASMLRLPPSNWTRWLVRLRAAQKRVVLSWLDRVPGARRRRSFVARRFAQAMIRLKRPDGAAVFALPPALAHSWGLGGGGGGGGDGRALQDDSGSR